MINHNTDSKKRLWVLGGHDASYVLQGKVGKDKEVLCKMSEKTVFFYFFRKPEENHKTHKKTRKDLESQKVVI